MGNNTSLSIKMQGWRTELVSVWIATVVCSRSLGRNIKTEHVYQGPLLDILSQSLTGEMVRDFPSQV